MRSSPLASPCTAFSHTLKLTKPQRDEDYRVQTWPEVVSIVRENRLGDFRRYPTELRRYREFVWKVQRDWGSVMVYLLSERIGWAAPSSRQNRSDRLFACPDDYKILYNDWPYGIDRRIVHLVVWTKFELGDDDETEAEIERFVERTFCAEVARDQVSDANLKRESEEGMAMFLETLTWNAACLVQEPAQSEVCPRRGAHPRDAV